MDTIKEYEVLNLSIGCVILLKKGKFFLVESVFGYSDAGLICPTCKQERTAWFNELICAGCYSAATKAFLSIGSGSEEFYFGRMN